MIDRRRSFLSGLSTSALVAAFAMSQGCSDESADGGNADAATDAAPQARTDATSDQGAVGSDGGDAGVARETGASANEASNSDGGSDSASDRTPVNGDGGDEASDQDAMPPVEPVDANPYLVPTCQPTAVTSPLITDFTSAGDASAQSQVQWGNWYSNFSGYSFYYPTVENGGLLTSNVATGEWRIAGVVSDYAGFGLGFQCKSDASRYSGVSFTIRGTIGGPVPPSDSGTEAGPEGGSEAGAEAGREAGAGPGDAGGDARDGATGDAAAAPIRLTFGISSAPTDVASTVTPSWGTCVPRTNQYDGTCVTPSTVIEVTPSGRTYRIRWTDVTGGVPTGVDPTQLTRIFWTLAWNGSATPRYAVDLTIDNVTFFDDAADAAAPADAQGDSTAIDGARD